MYDARVDQGNRKAGSRFEMNLSYLLCRKLSGGLQVEELEQDLVKFTFSVQCKMMDHYAKG